MAEMAFGEILGLSDFVHDIVEYPVGSSSEKSSNGGLFHEFKYKCIYIDIDTIRSFFGERKDHFPALIANKTFQSSFQLF